MVGSEVFSWSLGEFWKGHGGIARGWPVTDRVLFLEPKWRGGSSKSIINNEVGLPQRLVRNNTNSASWHQVGA